MRQDVFLNSVIIKMVTVLSGLFIVGVLIHWPMSYFLLASTVALVISLAGLWYIVAGGYWITQEHISETLEGMRG